MPRQTHSITAADILPLGEWDETRLQHRKALSIRKRSRRVGIGPHAMLYFENWDTMWYQVQEMLRIEKGGEAQLVDELAAYNPLIPQGSELVATFMIEIPDEYKRRHILGQLGGIEDTISIAVGSERIKAVSETEVERTTAEGKTSSIHFLHFPFSPAQIAAFRNGSAEVMVRIDHANYGHAAIVGDAVREELAGDFAG
jgi:hypothetical protein